MASLDDLRADQRAVLQLVLQRGRSYDEIARLLSIDRASVRERALSAFDALGPQTRVPPQRRALITDYLLGQLPPRVSDETRQRLGESASERAWARVLSSELAPLASGPLPDIPVEVSAGRPPEPPATRSETTVAAARRSGSESDPAAGRDRDPGESGRSGGRRSSRLGGAVLLAGAALVVVVVVIVVLAGGSGKRAATTPKTGSTPTTTTAASATSSGATVVAQINLKPTAHGNKAAGIAEVLREGATNGIAIVAQNLAPNTTHPPNAYAVWLYNSPTDAYRLGFVNPGVGSNGRLSTAGALPANASHYKDLIITIETQQKPATPGSIVLEGPLTGA